MQSDQDTRNEWTIGASLILIYFVKSCFFTYILLKSDFFLSSFKFRNQIKIKIQQECLSVEGVPST